MSFRRRDFLKTTVAAGAALSASKLAYGRIAGANEKVHCGVIGLNGRGNDHISGLKENVVAYCDCDEKVLEQKATGKDVETFVNFRELLDNKAIDAVSIATPNHWHSLIGIEAVMAGKHVYCEKPVSHNVWEGRQLVNAQKKFNRVVQSGTQSRSSTCLQSAVAYVRSGKLGKVQYAIGTCFKPRKSIGKLNQPLRIPSHLDYDMWCGPAEKNSLYRPQLHYDWHWDFNTGNGDMGNQGIHQMDVARWFLGYDTVSPRVLSIGGRVGYEDAGNTPNTQTVIHDYPDAPLIFETRGLPKSLENQTGTGAKQWENNMSNYRDSTIGVIVQCEQGHVYVSSSYSEVIVFDNDHQPIEKWAGTGDHYENFLDAVRAGDQSKLNAPIAEGHLSSALCHTGGVSHQLGQKKSLDEIKSVLSSESDLFNASFDRMIEHLIANQIDVQSPVLTLGADLKMDVATEQVTNHDEGNQKMTREYRAGYEVPAIA